MNIYGEFDDGQPSKETLSMDSYKLIVYPCREIPDQYRNLLFSKFLTSLREGNDYFHLIDKEAYFGVYNAYFATLLDRPLSYVKLAVLTDEPDVVLGWALFEPRKLHYVYVHKVNRRIGVATELLKEPFEVCTHLTKMALEIWSDKHIETKFNPFA
jgi:hypothetical protein